MINNENIITPQKNGDRWINKTYSITGNWAFKQKGDLIYFILMDNFQTSPGPDLKLYLTKIPMANIGNRDSINLDGLYIADLESNNSAQEYALPKGTDITAYNSLVIHCKRYSVVWGGIEL